jgi:hypothetical protein
MKFIFLYFLIFNISFSKTYTNIGINTFHIHDIQNKASLNNNNNLIGFEINNKNFSINFTYFKNSFNKDCYGIGIGKYNKNLLRGLILINGYTKDKLPDLFYIKNNFSVLPMFSYSYKINDICSLNFNILGFAINTSLKFKN